MAFDVRVVLGEAVVVESKAARTPQSLD